MYNVQQPPYTTPAIHALVYNIIFARNHRLSATATAVITERCI
jgi:hypothetical protein